MKEQYPINGPYHQAEVCLLEFVSAIEVIVFALGDYRVEYTGEVSSEPDC